MPVSVSGKDAWEVAREVSLTAGEILLDWWPRAKEVSDKGQNDIVTNVDRECEDHIRTAIRRHFPEHGVFGEEGKGDDPTIGWTWIIDPIDGTYDLGPGPRMPEKKRQTAYELSKCMTCGVCLEVCPNISIIAK